MSAALLDGSNLVDHVSEMMGEHAVERKKVEDRIQATKGVRRGNLSSRLRNRKETSSMNKKAEDAGRGNGNGHARANGNRVVPLPDDDDDESVVVGGGGGEGARGDWFGLSAAAALTPRGGWFGVTAANGADAVPEEHVVDIQGYPRGFFSVPVNSAGKI